MGSKIKVMEHGGKEIVYLDYTGFSTANKADFLKLLDEAKTFILERTDVLLLVDVKNSYADNEMVERLKKDAKEEKGIVKKEAVLGVSGIKGLFLQEVSAFSGLNIQTFDNKNDAIKWLIK